MRGQRTKTVLCSIIAAALLLLGLACLWTRTSRFTLGADKAVLAAAALSLPDGGYRLLNVSNSVSDNGTEPSTTAASPTDGITFDATPDETIYSEDPSQYANEEQYPVIETQYSTGQISYDNFYMKNAAGVGIDIDKLLGSPLGFEFERSDKVQVLIVHTHTTESYLGYDNGSYHESFYPRTTDNTRNIVRVGDAITEGLRRNGIGVVHATETHDSPQYDGSYSRSYDTIQKYLTQYPDIKVILDIHRDSISYGSDGGKIKPTFEYDGKKAAQIMIMAGCDPDGSLDFPFWEDNLGLALKLQHTAEQMYPGMTRPLYFGNFAYNMNVNNGSLLIEMGTDANTLAEAAYTGELLANVLSKVLQSS